MASKVYWARRCSVTTINWKIIRTIREKAKKLLAEAGYPNGLTVDFNTHAGRYQKDRETAQAIASQMARAGIKTYIKTPEYAIYEEELNNGKYGMYMFGRGSITDPEAFSIR